jgi:hypothetical protein
VSAEMIHHELIQIALNRVEGHQFERFVNAFYPAIAGTSFIPLGGVKDGGADGCEESIYEDDHGSTFYQASIEIDYRSKIRKTIRRLREFGRTPTTLVYVTSQSVKYVDKVERELTEELDITIKIRDAAYITAHINDGPQTRAAFGQHLRHLTDFLKSVGAPTLITPSRHVKGLAVYVFLAQELERHQGDVSLVNSIIDCLALWALEGTDPDAGLFRSRQEVVERIYAELPTLRALVEPHLGHRLEALASKRYPGGRQVRWHQKEDLFCLPYETRRYIEDENRADEALRISVLNGFDERIREASAGLIDDGNIRVAAEISLRALQLTFEREGLEFANFLEQAENSEYSGTITDAIAAALDERGISGVRRLPIGDAVFDVLRRVLYASRESERQYLAKLARTYTLLFTLNTEPRLIEYFQDMAGQFYLFVGSDVLVRALSEHYLASPDQMTRNTLLMAAQAGAKLVLTEPVLEEVVHHFRISDHEFHNFFEAVEQHVTFQMARNAPRIMLRAYLYARLNPDLGRRQPSNWSAFINQFCDYSGLHKVAAFNQVRQYLQMTFRLEFESTADLRTQVSGERVADLAERLRSAKSIQRLAENDALLALAVYGRRQARREEAKISEFGFETWWLTNETAILKHTGELVKENRDARYMMRPDFLLNFLTLAPSARQARAAFANVFPSLLGIKLARRMDEGAFHKIMQRVAEAESLDDARRAAKIASLSDRLKSDFRKQYATTFSNFAPATLNTAADVSAPPGT